MSDRTLRPIHGYTDYFADPSTGDIYSTKRGGKPRLMKPSTQTNGYQVVCLYDDGRKQTRYVHRLIWESVHGRIPEGMVVDHVDRDKTNNSIDGLRLANANQNAQNRSRSYSATHRFLGVSRHTRASGAVKYYGRVTYRGRVHYTSRYDSQVSAASARDYLARRIMEPHDFAKASLNFPWLFDRNDPPAWQSN